MFYKVARGFMELFVSRAMQVISYISALKELVAGTALDRSSFANAEIGPRVLYVMDKKFSKECGK